MFNINLLLILPYFSFLLYQHVKFHFRNFIWVFCHLWIWKETDRNAIKFVILEFMCIVSCSNILTTNAMVFISRLINSGDSEERPLIHSCQKSPRPIIYGIYVSYKSKKAMKFRINQSLSIECFLCFVLCIQFTPVILLTDVDPCTINMAGEIFIKHEI